MDSFLEDGGVLAHGCHVFWVMRCVLLFFFLLFFLLLLLLLAVGGGGGLGREQLGLLRTVPRVY